MRGKIWTVNINGSIDIEVMDSKTIEITECKGERIKNIMREAEEDGSKSKNTKEQEG